MKMEELLPLKEYSFALTTCRICTVEPPQTVTSQQQPVFNISKVQFYYIHVFNLSIAVTSLQQPLLCYPMGGCCRAVALYYENNISQSLTFNRKTILYYSTGNLVQSLWCMNTHLGEETLSYSFLLPFLMKIDYLRK